jgi:hypothetical protein
LKEIKQSLKKQLIKNSNDNLIIKLFHQGQELKKDTNLLGNLAEGEKIDLVMVCLTLTDEMLGDQKKMDEVLLKKLSPTCHIHKKEILILFCVNCSESICVMCEKDHKDHQIIHKNELLNFEENLKNYSYNLNQQMEDLGFDVTASNFYNNFRKDLSQYCEELVEAVELIKKKQTYIMNSFKSNLDNSMPNILDYRDKLQFLIKESDTKKEKLLNNDKDLTDFFSNYKRILNANESINSEVDGLKAKISKYKILFDEFKRRLEEILSCISEHFEKIKEYNLSEDSQMKIDLYGSNPKPSQGAETNRHSNNNSNHNINMNSNQLINNFNSSQSLPATKINLFNLMTTPLKGKTLSRIFEKTRKKPKSSESNLKADSEFSGNQPCINAFEKIEPQFCKYVASIEISTKNLLIYDSCAKTISKKELTNIPVKRFETYHSTLNYRNNFYISGGYSSSSKMIYSYNFENETFLRLVDMPNAHSYHSMFGLNDHILAISGFNSNKVDMYSIESKTWQNLADMPSTRSWPSVVSLNEKSLMVFGGLKQNEDKGLSTYEKYDIQKNFWETIQLKISGEIPFYFGVIQKKPQDNSSEIILMGGKFSKIGENISQCFTLMKDDILCLSELCLPFKDEFDGRQFNKLDAEGNFFGQFSSIYSERFYLFNSLTNVFEIIKYENKES